MPAIHLLLSTSDSTLKTTEERSVELDLKQPVMMLYMLVYMQANKHYHEQESQLSGSLWQTLNFLSQN